MKILGLRDEINEETAVQIYTIVKLIGMNATLSTPHRLSQHAGTQG